MEDFNRCNTGLLAQGMKDGGCPFSLGMHCKLNDAGEQFVQIAAAEAFFRCQLDENSEIIEWRKFRDIAPHGFSSLITGTKAIPSPGRWMDVEDEGVIQANYLHAESLVGHFEIVIE
jgi:hypothetical protein